MTEDDAPAPRRSHGRVAVRLSAAPSDLMGAPPRIKGAWRAKVITLFPAAFPGVLEQSLTGKAMDLGLWSLDTICLLYTSPSPRDRTRSRMPSSA